MLPLVYEKKISGYNLELTHEFFTRVNNNVGTMMKKKLPCALAGGDNKSLQVLCDKNLERRHVKKLRG